jgi:NTP pyrophosphatase (non-canonical NTP hydrolase)
MMTIAELVDRAYYQAVKSGWADRPVLIPEQVALICSEACEALESYRSGYPMSWAHETKPEGVGAEYADILIRVAHYAKLNGIDLEYEVERKLAYNETRPYKHGGKKA